MKRTPLYEQHLALNAKMVPFAEWEMPIHYGSQIEEHMAVREKAGIFDVSHMGVIDLAGEKTFSFLQFLLANDVAKLKTSGKALYTCILNETGGVLDDLIVYYFSPTSYRLVVNAGTYAKDLAWIQAQAKPFHIDIIPRTALAMIALQGPLAFNALETVLPAFKMMLKPFTSETVQDIFIARTGYTGENGVEIIAPFERIRELWQSCIAAEVQPCGLGARDTLRLEAGFNLYGSDMDETTTPLESNLTWTVSLTDPSRHFIGRSALEAQLKSGVPRQLVGLVLDDKGVLRNHQRVWMNENSGEITSGSYSPTLKCAIALARVPNEPATDCFVEIRDKRCHAKIVKPPFVNKK